MSLFIYLFLFIYFYQQLNIFYKITIYHLILTFSCFYFRKILFCFCVLVPKNDRFFLYCQFEQLLFVFSFGQYFLRHSSALSSLAPTNLLSALPPVFLVARSFLGILHLPCPDPLSQPCRTLQCVFPQMESSLILSILASAKEKLSIVISADSVLLFLGAAAASQPNRRRFSLSFPHTLIHLQLKD